MDARGHVNAEMRAESHGMLSTTRNYDPAMGWLTVIASDSGTSGVPIIQNLSYTYDNLGNLTQRTDVSDAANPIVEKSNGYDNLQRLQTQTGGTSATSQASVLANTYDALGNIQTNGSLTLQYANYVTHTCTAANEVFAAGPDAVVSASNGNTYCYDSHGNQTRVLGSSGTATRTQTYSATDALRTVTTANHATRWGYGLDRQRLVRQDYASGNANGTPTSVTHYLGNVEIDDATAGTITVKRYLAGLILTQTVANRSAAIEYDYLFTDNIGSTHRITDENGRVRGDGGSQRFSAYGLRTGLPSQGWLPLDLGTIALTDTTLTHHGFTGHEMMDESGLIHMNGRVYDPLVGRFIQADPFVQDASNLQSLNRYSYLLNNPLASTDPTGYWGHRQQGYLRDVAAIAISIVTYGVASEWAGLAAWADGTMTAADTAVEAGIVVAGGTAAGYVQAGNLKGAVLGGVESGLDFGIGQAFNFGHDYLSATAFENYGAHAALGGVMALLQGGKFGHGFVTAGVGSVLDPHYTPDIVTGTIQAAVVGGSVSRLTGGKFANGAITAAFEFAFNQSLEAMSRSINSMAQQSQAEVATKLGEAQNPEKVPRYAPYLEIADRTSAQAELAGAKGLGLDLNATKQMGNSPDSLRVNPVVGQGVMASAMLNFRLFSFGPAEPKDSGLALTVDPGSYLKIRIGAGLAVGAETEIRANGHTELSVGFGLGLGEETIVRPPATAGYKKVLDRTNP